MTLQTTERRLQREITRLAEAASGITGVRAIHIETGRQVSLNGQERFPMASTYKIPIAVQLLALVELQQLCLDELVQLKSSDLRPGSGIISKFLKQPGVALSLSKLC